MKYNHNVVFALLERGYSIKQTAIIVGCCKDSIYKIKSMPNIEPSLKYITHEQKQRWYVLNKLLELKPISNKWSHKDYVYITILKFLQIPRDVIYKIYSYAPLHQVANAYKEKSPLLKEFSYADKKINSEEWQNFVLSCYNILHYPEKWH